MMAASKAFVQSFGRYKKEEPELPCKEVERCRVLIRFNRYDRLQIYQKTFIRMKKSYKKEDSELACKEVER